MGYTLKIGEAKIDYSEDGVSIECDSVRLPDAPAYGESTDHTSERWPSYGAWHDAMTKLGLNDLMFTTRESDGFEWNGEDRCALINRHPGAMPITKEHVECLAARLDLYRKANPTHIAQFPPLKPGVAPHPRGFNFPEDYETDPKYDSSLCRGEWLLWWCRWAVENCKRPVFVNS